MAKVSICIPTYKQTDYLRKCLDSIFIQQYADYEVIVSDDSPDDSVKEFIEKSYSDKGLKYYKNNPSLGTPQNWNHSIDKASGNYIKLLHHDDYFTNKKSLSVMVDLLDENPKAPFVFCASIVWSVQTGDKRVHFCTDKQFQRLKIDPDFLFFKNVIGSPSATLFRRSKYVYDANFKWLVDVDYYRTTLKDNPEFVMTNEALICTADGAPNQVTQNVINDKKVQITEHLILFDKILTASIDEEKYILFFDELFKKFGIKNRNDLRAVSEISAQCDVFFPQVFAQMNNRRMYKMGRNWFYGSRFNNHLFHLEKY